MHSYTMLIRHAHTLWTGQCSGDTQPPLLALATAFVRAAGGVNDTELAWALPRLEKYIEWDVINRDHNKV
jgi:hypothetical protein